MMTKILNADFYRRPCLQVAGELVGKVLVRQVGAEQLRLRISETEAYCGEADTACHAHKGRTRRTEIMYAAGGAIYIYLCYGIHWLLNIVTGQEEEAEAVLIRACAEAPGPGRLTKMLQINGDLNKKSIFAGHELWIEDDGCRFTVLTDKRVGIGYAAPADQERLWRFIMGDEKGLTEDVKLAEKTIH